MDNTLTEHIYTFIRDYWAKHDYAPSHRDIAEGCHVSMTTVRRYLKHLEQAGRVRWHPHSVRTLHIPR